MGRRGALVWAGGRPDSVPGDFEWIIGDPHKESELHKLRLEYATGSDFDRLSNRVASTS